MKNLFFGLFPPFKRSRARKPLRRRRSGRVVLQRFATSCQMRALPNQRVGVCERRREKVLEVSPTQTALRLLRRFAEDVEENQGCKQPVGL